MEVVGSKHDNKLESLYSLSLKDSNTNSKTINELKNLLKINQINSNKSGSSRKKNETINTASEFFNKKTENNFNVEAYRTGFQPKRNAKISHSSLMHLPISEKALKSIIARDIKDTEKEGMKVEIRNQHELDLLSFKTHYIVKFSRNLEGYERILSHIDRISENNKKHAIDYYYRLKSLTESKDRVIFNVEAINSNPKNPVIIDFWKENISIFYETEVYWQKLVDLILKELKNYFEKNVELNKKAKDCECLILNKDNEIKRLNEYIRKNDVHMQAKKKKQKMNEISEIKETFERKEKENMINIFKLQQEIQELTNLLDKDKDYYNKFNECHEQLELRKKDIDEMRAKFNQELEDKKLKIAFLKDEIRDLEEHVIKKDQDIINFGKEKENLKLSDLDFLTKIKILNTSLNEKSELVEMLNNEVECWRVMNKKLNNELIEMKKLSDSLESDIVNLKKKIV